MDIETLRRKLNTRVSNTAVDPNDPLMAVAEMVDALLTDAVEKTAAAVEKVEQAASAAAALRLKEAEAASAKMVNDGGAWVRDAVRQEYQNGRAELAESRDALAAMIAEGQARLVSVTEDCLGRMRRRRALMDYMELGVAMLCGGLLTIGILWVHALFA